MSLIILEITGTRKTLSNYLIYHSFNNKKITKLCKMIDFCISANDKNKLGCNK